MEPEKRIAQAVLSLCEALDVIARCTTVAGLGVEALVAQARAQLHVALEELRAKGGKP